MYSDGDLTLAEALSSLREQLLDAIDQAQGEDLLLVCQGVEVELQVAVTTTRKGELKAGLWSVLTIGGGVDHADAATHKVKLSLMPELKGSSEKLKMADED
jgi:hypothetical protein